MQLLLLILLLFVPALAGATPLTLNLSPPSARLDLRATAIGLVPITAHVSRFEGTLTVDPARPGWCVAHLTAQVDSLEAGDKSTRETMIGPEFLDAARFPTLSFTGTCTGSDDIAGGLTMRGITRGLTLTTERESRMLVAQAGIRRALWGMEARPWTVGPIIRIRLETALP